MAGKAGLTWTSDTLTANLKGATAKGNAYLARTTELYSLKIEVYAKKNAKWTDRSGNARSSMAGGYNINIGSESSRFEVDIAHGMYYGIWLELRYQGRFAIINKSVENQGKAFFNTANQAMARMFGGVS